MDYPTELDDWIIRVAQNMARSRPEMVDDLAQEGRVAAWEVWNGHSMPEDIGYAKASARKHMLSIVAGKRRMLGSESARQKIVHDDPTDPSEIPAQQESLADYVILAYHHGEIHSAINELPPVQRRSTCMMMCDLPLSKAERMAWYSARPKLAAKLEHLRSMI